MNSELIFPVILVFLIAACDVNVIFVTDAEKIASFGLPFGDSPELSASLEAYSLVSYSRGDAHNHLYLVQSPNTADADKLAWTLGKIIPGGGNTETRMTVIETRKSPCVDRRQPWFSVKESMAMAKPTARRWSLSMETVVPPFRFFQPLLLTGTMRPWMP